MFTMCLSYAKSIILKTDLYNSNVFLLTSVKSLSSIAAILPAMLESKTVDLFFSLYYLYIRLVVIP